MVPGELILGLGADEWENEGSGSANSSPHCPRQVVATEFVDGCESPKKRARAKTADLNALKKAVLAEFQESYEAHGATLSQVLAAPRVILAIAKAYPGSTRKEAHDRGRLVVSNFLCNPFDTRLLLFVICPSDFFQALSFCGVPCCW